MKVKTGEEIQIFNVKVFFRLRVHAGLMASPAVSARSRSGLVEKKNAAAVCGATQSGAVCGKPPVLSRVQRDTLGFSSLQPSVKLSKAGYTGPRSGRIGGEAFGAQTV